MLSDKQAEHCFSPTIF